MLDFKPYPVVVSPTQPSLFCLLRAFGALSHENIYLNFRNEESSSKAWQNACLLALWKGFQHWRESDVKTI
jgi:hypothetical protein